VLATGLVLALSIGPRFLPYNAYTIVSGSMRPGIPVGSVAVVRPADAASLKPGDIISFHRPDVPNEIVTHRILRIETSKSGRFFVTKGDANSLPDPWRVPASGVGQRYAFDIPYLGYGVTALQIPIGRLFLGALLVFAAAALALRRIWRPRATGAQAS
jgi:signal peptidase